MWSSVEKRSGFHPLDIERVVEQLLMQTQKSTAKDALFLPGGRITKNEKREDAFERITLEELGAKILFSKAVFFNSYDHVYTDNYSEKDGFGTHYVTLCYEIYWSEKTDPTSTGQHTECVWITEEELLKSREVHEYTKIYFREAIRSENQYKVVATRRNSFNTMLWQTPALSLTAQAFLLNVAGNKSVDEVARVAACILAFCVALCTAQLFARHRRNEERDACWLEEFEKNHRRLGCDLINKAPERKKERGRIWNFFKSVVLEIREWPAFPFWMALLIGFAIASVLLLVTII